METKKNEEHELDFSKDNLLDYFVREGKEFLTITWDALMFLLQESK